MYVLCRLPLEIASFASSKFQFRYGSRSRSGSHRLQCFARHQTRYSIPHQEDTIIMMTNRPTDENLLGCEIFADPMNMPEDLASLRLRLLFEYSNLIDWADLVGLADKDDHQLYEVRVKANRAVVYATLCEMQMEVQSLASIVRKYLDEVSPSPPGDSTITAHDESLPELRDDDDDDDLAMKDQFGSAATDILQFHVAGPRGAKKKIFLKVLSASSKDIVRRHHPQKRIFWTFHYKKPFEMHLGRIQELVVYLQHTSDLTTQQTLLELGREACLSLVNVSRVQNGSGQKAAAAALHAIQHQLNDLQANVRTVRSSIIDDDKISPDFEKLLKFSLFRQKSEATHGEAPQITKHMVKDFVLPLTYWQERRTTATLGSSKVMIEWKKYTAVPDDSHNGDPFAPPVAPERVVRDVQRLCAMLEQPDLPVEFGLPRRCLGLVHDLSGTRYGFVFEHDAAAEEIELERALLDQSGAPRLNDKFEAAKKLTGSLLYLHAVGWLHKDINSANVLVASSQDYSMRLSGFRYNEAPTRNDPDGEMYRHPEYQGPDKIGYRKMFDIYSLGIILLEIAYWQPISSIMGFGSQNLAADPENLQRIRSRILEESAILGGVRKQMGDQYCQAVEACIRGGKALEAAESAEGEAQPIAGTLIQMAYTEKVVHVLKGIVV